MGKEKAPKLKKGKKNDLKEFEADDMSIYADLFKQLKGQFYKEKGGKSTLEALKESLGGAVLKDVTFFYQKLNKKSTETIVKTLKEFYALLETKPDEFFLSLITSYTIIHEKLLTTEFSRDVFINLMKIDQLIITRNKQAIKKNFRSFYPAWFLVQYEIMEDVKRMAKENLELLFPDKDKHPAAFFVSYPNYLTLVQSWLTLPAKQFKDINMFLDDDDCDRVHSRLLGLTMRSMDGSLALIADYEDADEYFEKLKATLRFDESGNVIVELFNRMKKDFSLRAEIAHLYLTLIDMGIEDFTSKQSPNLIKTFLVSADCKEPLLQKVFWENQLLLKLLPGIEQKPEAYDLQKVYKRFQTILEIGGMGIGAKYFENLNSFLKKSPLLNFSGFPDAKKFTASLTETFKQIEGFLKAYMACLEIDICKFYMGPLVDLYFDLSHHILVHCVLKTRSAIAKQTLFEAKDLTDALKKNIESYMDKFVGLLVLYPLELYLDKNSPDHMSEFAVGVNNYKFIPRAYARFLKRLISGADAELIAENKDLIEKALNKFAGSVASFSDNKKKFESYLALIDHLARERIEANSENMTSMADIINQLFSASSQFLQDFSAKTFDSEKIEKAFTLESFANFTKYFSNILKSDSDLNKQICETLVPSVVKRLVATLSDCLDDQFDLFDDDKKRLEIIHQLFVVFYTVQDWRAKLGGADLKEVDEIFGKLLVHLKEIQSVDDSMLLSKSANIATVIMALTPNHKPRTLLATLKSAKTDIKGDAVALAESNMSIKSTQFDNIAQSAKFKEVVLQTVRTFMNARQLPAIVLYDTVRRFAKYLPDETLVEFLSKVLTKTNVKDEFVGYKLASIENRIDVFSEDVRKRFVYLLFGYIHESRTFPTDATICDLEKFVDRLAPKHKNLILRSAVSLLVNPHEVFGKQNEASLTGTPGDYIILLDFFLNKAVREEDIDDDTVALLVTSVTDPTLFSAKVLSQVYPWLVFKAVLKSLLTKRYVKGVFEGMLSNKDQWATLHCILAAPSCLQIVMTYELRTFLAELSSTLVIPGLLALIESDQDRFLEFVKETIHLAVTQDQQYIYGLKKVLLQVTGDEMVDDAVHERVFLQVCQSLQEAAESLPADRLSDLVEITTNAVSYLSRSLLKKAFVKDFRTQIRERLFTSLGVATLAVEDGKPRQEVTVEDYSKIAPTKFLLDLCLYLSLCRGSKNNGVYEFKNVGFDLIDKQAVFGGRREVLLALLIRLLNVAVEDGDLEQFADRIPQIEAAYSEGISLSSFGAQKNLLLVAMLEFIRKVLGVLEMFSKNFEQNIHSEIMRLAVSRVQALQCAHFEHNPLKEQQTASTEYGCGFDELLVEFAETLSRFSLSQKIDIGENDLYLLLNCEVPVIQKSAFVVLTDYYETKITPSKEFVDADADGASTKAKLPIIPELLRVVEQRASTEEDGQVQKRTKKKQVQDASEILEIREVSEGKDLSLFSYVLTWIQFMHRIKSPRMQDSSERQYYEAMLNGNQRFYFGFLNQLFRWVWGLKIPGKDLEKMINRSPLTEMPLYWTDFIGTDTMFDLVLHAFYKFSSNFPKFLRNWIKESDKKYTGLAELVIKQKVSNLILDYEISQIENKEPSSCCLTQFGEAMSLPSLVTRTPRRSRLSIPRKSLLC